MDAPTHWQAANFSWNPWLCRLAAFLQDRVQTAFRVDRWKRHAEASYGGAGAVNLHMVGAAFSVCEGHHMCALVPVAAMTR